MALIPDIFMRPLLIAGRRKDGVDSVKLEFMNKGNGSLQTSKWDQGMTVTVAAPTLHGWANFWSHFDMTPCLFPQDHLSKINSIVFTK